MNYQSPAIEKAAREHALAEYPNEAVGVVVESPDSVHDTVYLPLENVSDDPTRKFELAATPRCQLFALIHSHTMDPSVAPSRVDMASQQAMHIPWGIIGCSDKNTTRISWFGDQLPVQPLLGRKFLSGHTDCWGLVRDVYRSQFGITLRNIPRDENWYKHEEPHGTAQDLLGPDSINETGFQIISRQEAKAGDVVLGRIGRTGVVNHCGLLVGNGLILHHLEDRLSRREPVGPWMRHVQFVARHNSFVNNRELVPVVRITQ